MMLRTRASVSIGLVLIALAIGLGLVADPLLRRTLSEQRELAGRLAALHPRASGRPPDLACESSAVVTLWIAVALACVVAPTLCAIALRALFAPVAALRKACQDVPAWGSARPLAEPRSDELGHLCSAFDRMRANVEQSRQSRERYHGQLETTVEQKTRQLAATVERLRSLDQMKDAFLACASRELQRPIRSVLATCDELALPASVEPRVVLLRRILFDCRHVGQMTQDVLDFVRTSSDGFDYRFEPTTVETVVRRAVASVRERMPRSDVEVELAHLGDCAVVWDGDWIVHVLESIVMQVLQRAPSGSTVFVENRQQGPDVRIEIRFDSLGTQHVPIGGPAASDPGELGRVGRSVWTPVLARHLGEWSEQQSDAHTSIVIVLPAMAEHLAWSQPAVRAGSEAGG